MSEVKSIVLLGFQCRDLERNVKPARWNEYSNYPKEKRDELYKHTIRDIITDEELWNGSDIHYVNWPDHRKPISEIWRVSFTFDINIDRIHGYRHDDELQANVVLDFTHDLGCVEVQLLTMAAHPVVTYYFRNGAIDTRDLTPADIERCVKKAYLLYTQTDISFPNAEAGEE